VEEAREKGTNKQKMTQHVKGWIAKKRNKNKEG